MTRSRASNHEWSLHHSNRRRFLQALSCLVATGGTLGVAKRGLSQDDREVEAVSAWMKGGKSYVPPNGYVPDKKTALRVAEAILTAVYGEQKVASERPLKISLVEDGAWLIWGTLDRRYLGGTAVIKLSKQTGRVLFLSHGQ